METVGYAYDSWAGEFRLEARGGYDWSGVALGNDRRRYHAHAAAIWEDVAAAADRQSERVRRQLSSLNGPVAIPHYAHDNTMLAVPPSPAPQLRTTENFSFRDYRPYLQQHFAPSGEPMPSLPPASLMKVGTEEIIPAARAAAFRAAFNSYAHSGENMKPRATAFAGGGGDCGISSSSSSNTLHHHGMLPVHYRCAPLDPTYNATGNVYDVGTGREMERATTVRGGRSNSKHDDGSASRRFFWGELWQRYSNPRDGLMNRAGFLKAALFVIPIQREPQIEQQQQQQQREASFTAMTAGRANDQDAHLRLLPPSMSPPPPPELQCPWRRGVPSACGEDGAALADLSERTFQRCCSRRGYMTAADFLAACRSLECAPLP